MGWPLRRKRIPDIDPASVPPVKPPTTPPKGGSGISRPARCNFHIIAIHCVCGSR